MKKTMICLLSLSLVMFGLWSGFKIQEVYAEGSADLTSMYLSAGTLNGKFDRYTVDYTATANNGVSSITITPTAADSEAIVKVNNEVVERGSASNPISLNVGSNTIKIVVTAPDGMLKKTYTVNVTRLGLESSADLSSLYLSEGFLGPVFAPDTTSYTAYVHHNVEETTVTATLANSAAKILINSSLFIPNPDSPDEFESSVELEVGSNTITVEVRPEDGGTSKVYTVTVIRAEAISSNALLEIINLTSGKWMVSFFRGTTDYTANVTNDINSITVEMYLSDENSTVKVNGEAAISNQSEVDLIEGSNTIKVEVTAQDGITKEMYTITVTRAAALKSNNADLSSMILSNGILSPTFGSELISYTANVASDVNSLTVTPTVADSGATVKVNGIEVATGAESKAIDLNVGDNTITVEVTAQDGTTKTYTVMVTRPALPLSNNADLSSLRLSVGSLSPMFTSGTITYTSSVANSESNIKITPTVADSDATVKINGIEVATGAESKAIDLNVGDNTITVEVTAQDGTTKKVYTITVKRANETPDSGGGTGTVGGVSAGGKVTSTNGTLTVPVGNSGEVSLPNEVTIVIPAGTSDQELKITIEKLMDMKDLVSNQEVLISPIYEILKNITENFAKAVTLTFVFDSASLNENEQPVVFFYDEVKKEWVQIEGGKVDGNKITVVIDHFTKFAVMAVNTQTEPSESVQPTFNDITGHWAASDINKAAQIGIVNGYKDGTFKPDGDVTRAEFIVMLMKLLKPQDEATEITFIDSDKVGTWAIDAVEQAVQAGIVQGYSDGSFRPNAEITRTEMAMMIAKVLALKVEENAVTNFSDDAVIPSWAKAQVAALKNLGLLSGKGNNEFAPNDKATRAEAVTILLKVVAQQSK